MSADTVRRALDVCWLDLALGHRRFETEGGTFVVNTTHPSIHDANFVYDVTASTEFEIDALLARSYQEYAHCRELTFRIGPHAPRAFEARLALVGREHYRILVLLLEGALAPTAARADIRPIDDEGGWAAFRELKREEWREQAARMGHDPERIEIADGLSATNRLKCPPVRYWMAYADGRPVGYFNAWEGVDGIGQVEDLFVVPAYRHRGIATALIHHCVADARAHGAKDVVICSLASDTPKHMYAALGWRPIALTRQYGVKRETLSAPGASRAR